MKNLVVVIISVLMTINVANAQKQKLNVHDRATKQAARLEQLLSLSTDQRIKIDTLIANKITKMQAIKAKYKGQKNKNSKGEELKTVKSEYDNELAKILTSEQQQKLAEIKAKNKENKKENKGKGEFKGKGKVENKGKEQGENKHNDKEKKGKNNDNEYKNKDKGNDQEENHDYEDSVEQELNGM